MKISALAFAAALAVTGSAFAATTHDGNSGSSSYPSASAHQLERNFTGALHKIGAATRHALHRADASLHRAGKHENEHAG